MDPLEGPSTSPSPILSQPSSPSTTTLTPAPTTDTRPSARTRTVFNSAELALLEAAFYICSYPDSSTKEKLARALGLDRVRIMVWFQNRRARSRKHLNKASKEPNLERFSPAHLLVLREYEEGSSHCSGSYNPVFANHQSLPSPTSASTAAAASVSLQSLSQFSYGMAMPPVFPRWPSLVLPYASATPYYQYYPAGATTPLANFSVVSASTTATATAAVSAPVPVSTVTTTATMPAVPPLVSATPSLASTPQGSGASSPRTEQARPKSPQQS